MTVCSSLRITAFDTTERVSDARRATKPLAEGVAREPCTQEWTTIDCSMPVNFRDARNHQGIDRGLNGAKELEAIIATM